MVRIQNLGWSYVIGPWVAAASPRRFTADGEFKETPFPVLAGCFDAQLTHYSGASGEELDERMCFLRVPYRQ